MRMFNDPKYCLYYYYKTYITVAQCNFSLMNTFLSILIQYYFLYNWDGCILSPGSSIGISIVMSSHLHTGSDTNFDLMVKIKFCPRATRQALLAHWQTFQYLAKETGFKVRVGKEINLVYRYALSKRLNTSSRHSLQQMFTTPNSRNLNLKVETLVPAQVILIY